MRLTYGYKFLPCYLTRENRMLLSFGMKGMEWNGMEWNGMERKGKGRVGKGRVG